jgi:PPK2 family polyphosphate:nucleotide phosphotransferase
VAQRHRLDRSVFLVSSDRKMKLKDHDPGYTGGFRNKVEAKEALIEDVSTLAAAQERLWASGDRAVLIIFQAMDAAGKDGAIKHVMTGINPQGCDVHAFRAPSEEERQHPFLWRPVRFLPAQGRIAIFNRSYYEEVLVVRVHPHFLESQWIPQADRALDPSDFWKSRYEQINQFEHGLAHGGTTIIKFFLHVSKDEQKRRFLARLDNPEKHWKFSAGDVRERKYWNQYMEAYEDMLSATSTPWAPWHVIPADKKWFTRACVADIITAEIEKLDLQFPQWPEDARHELANARAELMDE